MTLSILEISNPHWLTPELEGRKGEHPNGEDRDHDQLNHLIVVRYDFSIRLVKKNK